MATKTINWETGGGTFTVTYGGSGDGTIVVTSDANNGDARSQDILVQTTDGTKEQVVTINQLACPFPIGEVKTFSQSGSYYITLVSGRYQLEVWGAQGGTCTKTKYTTAQAGGKGGYSKGVLSVHEDTKIRVYVGGQGTSTTGGYNGGGNGASMNKTSGSWNFVYEAAGGGGASDIRISSSLYSRIIVAGGGSGGAAGYRKSGGSIPSGNNLVSQVGYVGGGSTSGGYDSHVKATRSIAGTNGSFGNGAESNGTGYRAAGGGGGWYGGGSVTGSGTSESNVINIKKSGGGGGWVNTSANASYRPTGYTGLQLASGTTYDGSQSFPNTAGTGNETGHSGDGYARITRLA